METTELVKLILEYVVDTFLILIPFLIIIGFVVKNTKRVSDELIPIILIILGIAGAIGLNGFGIDSIIQGVLVAGGAVLSNETIKQMMKLKDKQ